MLLECVYAIKSSYQSLSLTTPRYHSLPSGHVMAWDFSDSSFRPSIILKATHSKLTSMEFLTSSSLSFKHQLLAAGDETGTLHIFEMPRSLVRPAHKEAALMSAFLDREREVRDVPSADTTNVLIQESQSCLLSLSFSSHSSLPSSSPCLSFHSHETARDVHEKICRRRSFKNCFTTIC